MHILRWIVEDKILLSCFGNSQHDTIDVPQTLGNKYFESLKISFKLKPEIHKKTKKSIYYYYFLNGLSLCLFEHWF